MKDRFAVVVEAVFLSLLMVSLIACTSDKHGKESKSDAIPVIVGSPQKVQEMETISVSGTVSTPKSPTHAGFLVSGKVMFVGPREGDFVRMGQVLASSWHWQRQRHKQTRPKSRINVPRMSIGG